MQGLRGPGQATPAAA